MTDPVDEAGAPAAPAVGVGPWEGPWPEGEQWDPELLEHGDRRNVVDGYRYWTISVPDLADVLRALYPERPEHARDH